jgi:rod shape-determining protein MreC
LALLGLLGWHVHVRATPAEHAGLADRTLLAVTGPIQKAITEVARLSSSTLSDYFMVVGVKRQNRRILLDLNEARAGLAELGELRHENERLRQLHGLRARVPGRTVGASIIGRGISSRFHTLRIDRGARAGLREGQGVIARGGAVGQVLRVSEQFADVLLLTDGLSTVGSVLQRSRLRGVAAGQGGEFLELGFIRRRELHEISLGDLVVSSGEDGLFPEGVPLGRVTQVRAPETGLFLEVTLESAVDLDRVEEVLVIVDGGTGPFQFPQADLDLPPAPEPAAGDDAPAFAPPAQGYARSRGRL